MGEFLIVSSGFCWLQAFFGCFDHITPIYACVVTLPYPLCVFVSSLLSLIRTPVIGLRSYLADLGWSHLKILRISTWSHLEIFFAQIKSHLLGFGNHHSIHYSSLLWFHLTYMSRKKAEQKPSSEGQNKFYLRYSSEVSWTLTELSNYFTVKEAY